MPTVHLSLPDKTYRELKKKAAELGIQVTDLIKLYIRNGLEYGLQGPGRGGNSGVERLEEEILELKNEVRGVKVYVRGRMREFEELFAFLQERLDQLEDIVDTLIRAQKTRKPVYAADE